MHLLLYAYGSVAILLSGVVVDSWTNLARINAANVFGESR